MNSEEHIRAAWTRIGERIVAAGGVGVDILPVTKGFGVDAIWAAAALGADAVGENYVQELRAKWETLGDRAPVRFRFIGQLQTNKVRYLAGNIEVYQSVDRPALIDEIAKRDPGARILIQVRASGGTTADGDMANGDMANGDMANGDMAKGDMANGDMAKGDMGGKGGCRLDELDRLAEHAVSVGLRLDGLMTVGPTQGGPEAARPGFAAVRSAVDRLGLQVCSMGMSQDLEVAVAEGSTQVRIGSALFGARTNHVSAGPVG